MIDQPVGAALERALAPPSEAAERQIDRFIERRHSQRVRNEGERRAEESWKASERRLAAAREAEEALGRRGMIDHLRRVYRKRADEYDALYESLGGFQ